MGLPGRIAAGIAGFVLPILAAPIPADNVFQMGPLANRLLKHPTGRVMVRSSQVGGAVALGQMAWHYREDLGHAGARTLQTITIGRYQAPTDAWENTPRSQWQNRGVQFTTKTERISRKGDGPSSLSQRTRRSPSFGKRRRRCRHRNKAGKQCLRPATHSGRHRYR